MICIRLWQPSRIFLLLTIPHTYSTISRASPHRYISHDIACRMQYKIDSDGQDFPCHDGRWCIIFPTANERSWYWLSAVEVVGCVRSRLHRNTRDIWIEWWKGEIWNAGTAEAVEEILFGDLTNIGHVDQRYRSFNIDIAVYFYTGDINSLCMQIDYCEYKIDNCFTDANLDQSKPAKHPEKV